MIKSLLMIVRRSLRQHAVSTTITVLAVALASGLVMSVYNVTTQTRTAFMGGNIGFDAVLGARGSQLQLVLNTVFHLETSPGNIPWSQYQELRQDRRVRLALPYMVGDNFRGFRIVGTTDELFTKYRDSEGAPLAFRPGGRAFDPTRREAVLGATAARETGLDLNDTFQPIHGVADDPNQQHADVYVVVGVLESTNTPNDRAIWIPIEGTFRMEGHVLMGTGEAFMPGGANTIPDEHKEISAVMLSFAGPRVGQEMSFRINRQGKVSTLAWPIDQALAELFDKMGWVVRILELVSALVVVVAAGSILASLYNTMNERRREFAILRALGARRRIVFAAIVLESGTIAALGSLVGYLVYTVIMTGTAWLVRDQTGVVLDVLAFHPALIWTPIGMMLLGAFAGTVPAIKAYATDVAASLVPMS